VNQHGQDAHATNIVRATSNRKPLSAAALKKARTEADSILHQFLIRLREVKILDPACGSGNFLYVALLRLKDLEREAAVIFPSEHGLNTYLPGVGPWQLYGLEINPYAHGLAQMTVWIGWLQWIRVNGFGFPADPILRPLSDNIRLQDAIIDCATGERGTGVPPVSQHGQDAHATSTAPHGQDARATNVREPEWPAVDFIIGNPPFLGGNRIRQELGSDYVEQLFALYEGRVPAFADLCCYWFEKARAHIAAGKCRRAGLLATQGIRGGANREVLKRIKESATSSGPRATAPGFSTARMSTSAWSVSTTARSSPAFSTATWSPRSTPISPHAPTSQRQLFSPRIGESVSWGHHPKRPLILMLKPPQ
jgi:hypothetical protein